MIRANRANRAKSCLDMLMGAIISEMWYYEQVLIIEDLRLTEQKNTLFIIDIFNALVKKEPSAKLLIIGDGNLREAMLAKIDEYGIKDHVLYLGRREDIPQFYNAMDCFLLRIPLITLLLHMIWQHLLIPVKDNRGYLTLVYVQ